MYLNSNCTEEEEDIVGLFDMDNTLFDYDGQLRKDLERLKSPNEEMPENLHDESIPWIKARMDLIKTVPGWWRNLPLYQPGWDILTIAEELGFENMLYTKGPRSKTQAWAEKVDALVTHLGYDRANIVITSKDKSGQYGRFLVDDYSPYALGWLKKRPRGLVIMPAHKYNEDCKHPQVLRYTGNNLAQVRAALEFVRYRKVGEPWTLDSIIKG